MRTPAAYRPQRVGSGTDFRADWLRYGKRVGIAPVPKKCVETRETFPTHAEVFAALPENVQDAITSDVRWWADRKPEMGIDMPAIVQSPSLSQMDGLSVMVNAAYAALTVEIEVTAIEIVNYEDFPRSHKEPEAAGAYWGEDGLTSD